MGNDLNLEKKEIIIKELEIIQGIIARQEQMRITSRNWFITIITALTVAFISKEIALQNIHYLIISLTLSALFIWLEVIHRVAEQRAMDRGQIIESAIRNESTYNGPFIGKSLDRPNSFKEQIRAINNVRIYSTYLVIAILSITVYIFKS